ncbi:MAG: nitrate reductase [Chloroflexota bacterium]
MMQSQNDSTHQNGRVTERGTQYNTYCPYCGVGCGLRVSVADGQVTKVAGNPEHPSTLGELCLKPIHLPSSLNTPDRIRDPLIRMSELEDTFQPTTWEMATEYIAEALSDIIGRYGPDSVAFYGSGQFTTEDYYVANKLLKGFIGTNNFDANSRLCMASAVVGYVTSLGSDGPPPAYEDIDVADCFFLIGTNTADCHPVLYNRIKRRKKSAPDQVKVIVVDPRETRTTAIADLHLSIRPGTDVVLLNGMLNILYRAGKVDVAFIEKQTNGFELALTKALEIAPNEAAEFCGISEGDLTSAAMYFGNATSVLSFWSMGLNQSVNGVAKNHGVINLHLATGQIGKPGSGPFSLTGQPNAMGGREAGGLCHILPGYRLIANSEHRQEVEDFWDVPEGRITSKPGLAAVEMFEAAARGDVKAMWIMCTNPVVSMPNLDVIEAAMENLELLIVTDAYHPTDTTQYAHVLLPAAQWSEREGVMTNSERRITYLPQMVRPIGLAKPDWRIMSDVAAAMGYGSSFSYESAADVFHEFVQLTQGRLCDYSGVSYDRLQSEGPLQWPVPNSAHPGTARLYTELHMNGSDQSYRENGISNGAVHTVVHGISIRTADAASNDADGKIFRTDDGKAKFRAAEYVSVAEEPSEEFPLILTTGRLRNQWHTMTRTGKSASLMKGAPEPFLEIHPTDAGRRRIESDDIVEIRSQRGTVWAKARVTKKIRQGTCFMPFHWGRLAGKFKAANNVTTEAVDPLSKEPELKACAVQVRLRPGYQVIRTSKIYQRLAAKLRGGEVKQ